MNGDRDPGAVVLANLEQRMAYLPGTEARVAREGANIDNPRQMGESGTTARPAQEC